MKYLVAILLPPVGMLLVGRTMLALLWLVLIAAPFARARGRRLAQEPIFVGSSSVAWILRRALGQRTAVVGCLSELQREDDLVSVC